MTEKNNPDVFTAAQDAQLLKLKQEDNKTWKEVASALGKPVGNIKKRFHEIKLKDEVELRKEQERKAKTEAAKAKAEQAKADRAKAEPVTMSYADYMKAQAAKRAAPAEEKTEPQVAEATEEQDREYIVLQPDENFSHDEVSAQSFHWVH